MTLPTVTHVTVNRAPVLTLWAAVVACRLGFDRDEALTMGRAVAGLDAHAKAKSLGLYPVRAETVPAEREQLVAGRIAHVELLNRSVPVMPTPQGLRAVSKGRPIMPQSVQRYLESKFGGALPSVERAMTSLARSFSRAELSARAYGLYEKFRPHIPPGVRGWGAAGDLAIEQIRLLGKGQDAAVLQVPSPRP